jgi:glutamate dehydrogenase (NAD(P)+)
VTILDHTSPAAATTGLADARDAFRGAVAPLGYDESVYDTLAVARQELTVSIPLRRDDGTAEILIGHRVRHNLSRGPREGELATTRPSAWTRCGAGDADDLEVRAARRSVRWREGWHPDRSEEPRQGRTRAGDQAIHERDLTPLLGTEIDIRAQDVGTDEQTMAWMMDTCLVNRGHTVLGVVTGKPVSLGGLLGLASATSRGVAHIALAALETRGVDAGNATAAIQGFGKVDRGAARFLHDAGLRITAISDQYGAVKCATGIDVLALEEHVDRTGSVVDFAGGTPVASKDDLLFSDVDLLVPALEGVINAATAGRVLATIVAEGANGPTTPDAEAILADQGCLVVPDILVNAGGVVVSCFERVLANRAYWWSADEVEQRLAERMSEAWRRATEHATRRDVSLRDSATSVAVPTVAEAHRMRGLYP